MPRLFNSSLLNPRDVLIIGAIAVIAHIALKPLFNAVDGNPNT